jgi:transcriptional regulator with XRE-family HTH domain
MAIRMYPNLHAFFRAEGRVQDDVARDLGISPGLLSMFKWGERQPRLELALRISERCRVPLESLVLVRRPRPAKAADRPRHHHNVMANNPSKHPTLPKSDRGSLGSPGKRSQIGKSVSHRPFTQSKH